MKRYLGLDIGTTSLKAAAFDETGRRLALRHVDYTLDTDAATGFIEFDANRYYEMCVEVIEDLTQECGGFAALSIDTQGETMILADQNGTPLCPAIVWLDNRAKDEAEEIRAHFGTEHVYNVTGQPEITAGWPASKLLWIKRHRPEIAERVSMIFMLEDWILYKLTGNFVTEPTIQSSTIYYDIHRLCWWEEMLSFIGFDTSRLPRCIASAEQAGEYKGIKVIAGALDQIAGTIGVGVTDESLVSEMTGTIMAICVMKQTPPPFDPAGIVPCHLHAIPGKYCMILWSSTAGMALKWFREQFMKTLSFPEIDALAAEVPPGCDGMTMLPYFCGSTIPNYNPDATATFSGITLSHTGGHFARAIMEAVAFMLRLDLEYAGVKPDCELRITGGGASGSLWPQIKADVTGMRLDTVCETETACLGAAILAMVGDGAYSSIEECANAVVKTNRAFLPSGADYEQAYRAFLKLDDLFNQNTETERN